MLSAILSDQPDDVLADLRRQLERRIAEARNTLAASENELRLVEEALAARGQGTTGGASGRVDVERDREPDGRFQGIPRATILAVASSLQDPITPQAVVEAFAERGETVNVEQIRIALSRIAKDGKLTKIGPSLFTVPGRPPAEVDQPREEAPPSQPGLATDPFRRGVLSVLSRDELRRNP